MSCCCRMDAEYDAEPEVPEEVLYSGVLHSVGKAWTLEGTALVVRGKSVHCKC